MAVENGHIVTTVDQADQYTNIVSGMEKQLGRKLTTNEKLTVSDDIRKKNGLPGNYTKPLPGVTAEFVSFSASFLANILQRTSGIGFGDNGAAAVATAADNYLQNNYDVGGDQIDYDPNDSLAGSAADIVSGAGNGVADWWGKLDGQMKAIIGLSTAFILYSAFKK